MSYLKLFVDALQETCHLVLSFLDMMFRFFIVVLAAALPLFIVFGILIFIVWLLNFIFGRDK